MNTTSLDTLATVASSHKSLNPLADAASSQYNPNAGNAVFRGNEIGDRGSRDYAYVQYNTSTNRAQSTNGGSHNRKSHNRKSHNRKSHNRKSNNRKSHNRKSRRSR